MIRLDSIEKYVIKHLTEIYSLYLIQTRYQLSMVVIER